MDEFKNAKNVDNRTLYIIMFWRSMMLKMKIII